MKKKNDVRTVPSYICTIGGITLKGSTNNKGNQEDWGIAYKSTQEGNGSIYGYARK